MVHICSKIHYAVQSCQVLQTSNKSYRQTESNLRSHVKVYTIYLLLTGNNDGCLGSFWVLVPCHIQSKQKLGVL
jgi:hypothetical protein